MSEATVNITDVEPTAVRTTGAELRVGDVVRDVWGRPYPLVRVTSRPKSRTVRFVRADGHPEVIGMDETITVTRVSA